ncbi:ATP-dependent RNA helicase [Candidatus Micrarchaeota archaeon RBG_16_49_10]|nr:MAG: ATP-dependent RNA helicase [Candidatus Micrarchaeota archaeon RBG_16_49_10]
MGSLDRIGFESPTMIQFETIPQIKQGYDVIGQSETGSGKTAAFGIPLVEKVMKGSKVQALVLAPTRELALQITEDLRKFSYFKRLRVEPIYGGVPINPQISGLRDAEIVVGTPGRILDHMERGTLRTDNVKVFVLDEADKMIDMGFIEDIEMIERNIPKQRQTLLFSATMPESMMRMRERFTKDARKIKTKMKVDEAVLKQYYCDVKPQMKFSLLVHLIKKENPNLSIVFCNSKRDVDVVAENLKENGINAAALHGGMVQNKRERVMESFHAGQIKVLIATDVASRGLDIKDVTHVFNYSVPKDPEDYANRIGRTARAGKSGKAITLLCSDDHQPFRRMSDIYSYDVEKLEVEDLKMLPFKRNEQRGDRFNRFGRDRDSRFSRDHGRRHFSGWRN